MSNIHNLAAVNNAVNEARQVEWEARDKRRGLQNERRALKHAAIGEMFDEFVEAMRGHAKTYYIRGQHSCDFTRHVNRDYGWISRYRDDEDLAIRRIKAAQQAYMKAFEELNRVFVEEVLANPEEMRRVIVNNSTLKNLKRVR